MLNSEELKAIIINIIIIIIMLKTSKAYSITARVCFKYYLT